MSNKIDPLPPFASIDAAIAEALPALNPPARIGVEDAAARRSIEDGGQWVPWRPDVAPYMSEPMAMVTSRVFDSVVFVGPARSSKSEALVINPLVHAVLAQPRLVAVFSPGRDAAKEWSVGMLDPLIRNSPELQARLAAGRGGDNIFEKKFRGGARVTVDWPVGAKLAQRSIPLVIFTDYDKMDDVPGEGTPFALGRKRTQSAFSRAMAIAESSPRKPILDEDWQAATPHEAPPTEGILALYNHGTRGRLYWTCPDCSGQFEPRFERMQYPDAGTPAERGAAAFMACLHCGAVLEQKHRKELNAGARWLHEGPEGDLVPMGSQVRATSTASYHLAGPAAALAPWSQIVARYLEGEQAFEATGDEAGLQTATNVELGLPYLPRAQGIAAGLSKERLRQGVTDHTWQEAPAGTAFITVAVDVQVGRFVVQVEAWQADLERVIIDRFDIFAPPEGAPRADKRRIDPSRYIEDWAALVPLLARSYRVAAADHSLLPLAMICDCGGEAGVTPRAYDFWRAMKATHPRRFFLVRGRGGEAAKRAEVKRPDSAHKGKHAVARDVNIVWAGSDRLKDEVAASLLREADGARALHIPAGAPSEVCAEYAAERRTAKGWEKKPGIKRNEALDLSVYSLALVIVLGAERIKWDRAPRWALAGPENSFAQAIESQAQEAAPAPAQTEKKPNRWRVKRPRGPV